MAVKQRQSQKQNVNVNINLGEKKKKGKPKKRKTGKKRREGTQPLIIPAFNPPPIINYPPMFNQKPNTFLNPPPPIPQKEYSVFPEAETAPLTNILSTVPTILKLQTTEPEPNLAKATAKEPEVQPFAPEVAEEPIFTTEAEEPEPTFFNAPETTTNIGAETEANIEPLLTPAEEESYKQLTSQYRAAELPVQQTFNIPSLKELVEKKVVLPAGSVKANVAYSPFQLYSAPKQSLLPEEPPSPTASTISSLSYEPLLGAPSPSFFNVGGLKLPPLNLPPRQQITGAEEILGGSSSARTYKKKERLPKNEPVYEEPAFFFLEGQTGRTAGEYSAPLTASSLVPTVAEAKKRTGTLADFGLGGAPAAEEKEEEVEEPLEKKGKGGRPKGSKNKPKISVKQTQFAGPAQKPIIGQAIEPAELALSISQQPNIQFLGGTQKTFLAEPAPPLAPITGGIQRKRGGAVAIPAAEEDILLKQPNIPTAFLTQRSQTTL